MRFLVRAARRQTLGLIGLLVGISGLAAAATGEPLLGGRSNSVSAPTTLTNSGAGPALDLRSKAAAPPLKVSSTKKVRKLNADLLDGKHAKSFAAAGASYTKAQSDARYPSAKGSLTFEISPLAMTTNDGALTLAQDSSDVVEVVTAVAPGAHDVVVPVTAPLEVSGVRMRADTLRVCYAVSDAATKIDETQLVLVGSGGMTVLFDSTDRNSTGVTCYAAKVDGSAWLDGSPALRFALNFGGAGQTVQFWRIELTLTPSDIPFEGPSEGPQR